MEDTDVPRALVKRIVKAKIAVLDSMASEEAKKEVQLNKDAILALSESAKIFITYLTATANDICRESKRQIISADDIFAALTDLDFSQLVAPLNQALEAFKVENKEKNKKKAEQVKKRKASKI
ncbi:hypothetical protein WJX72_004334 [[Myrmecia] bisecta]|uniref:Core Histone H2A/H2B/H3 domain-containing protein n=1 Tax=[Myrmecia] bisecta TaxID=41462 RepID=A0AAW1PS59_9CHLO